MKTKMMGYSQKMPESASYQRHKRQRFWQILTPVLLSGLIILAAAVLMILTISGVSTGVDVSQYADTSLIWILFPVLLAALVVAIVLFGLVYLLARVLNILPRYSFMVQYYVLLISDKIRVGTKKVAAPFITVKSVSASIHAFFRALAGRSRKD